MCGLSVNTTSISRGNCNGKFHHMYLCLPIATFHSIFTHKHIYTKFESLPVDPSIRIFNTPYSPILPSTLGQPLIPCTFTPRLHTSASSNTVQPWYFPILPSTLCNHFISHYLSSLHSVSIQSLHLYTWPTFLPSATWDQILITVALPSYLPYFCVPYL